MTFGKKGAAQKQQQMQRRAANPFAQPASGPVSGAASMGAPAAADDALAAQRAAFIAAERSRAVEGDYSAVPATPISAHRAQYSGPAETYIGSGQLQKQPGMFDHLAPAKPSLTIAYILWIVLSNCGAHRFYLGQSKGVFQQFGLLLISTLLAFAVHMIFAVGILAWGLWVLSDLFFIRKWHQERMDQSRPDTGIFA